ncbi:HEAT domain containing protein [Ammonifex degensii KC4]|uniref:HEAT domain containing protein n=1 Tax=Ammonifex degensii (strain DSM 10501 / KC4) TaxID=429009 RepID=C9R8C7_AMMDK|nr:HEAT repeat domain-containing protein [Ammonifex degensii]ACX52556.1 HEAT domain containing protein [Ammonifex degensii KC4]
MIKKFCPSCYHENPPEKKVCEKCGAPLEGGHHEDFLTKLIWAVKHPEPETRLRAVELLGKLGPRASPASPVLASLFYSPDPFLRAAVVRTLGKMKERPDILLKALKDSSFLVRLASLESLKSFETSALPAGLAAILQNLAREDPSPKVKREAQALLSRIKKGGDL